MASRMAVHITISYAVSVRAKRNLFSISLRQLLNDVILIHPLGTAAKISAIFKLALLHRGFSQLLICTLYNSINVMGRRTSQLCSISVVDRSHVLQGTMTVCSWTFFIR